VQILTVQEQNLQSGKCGSSSPPAAPTQKCEQGCFANSLTVIAS
jgi:hypothetical protein